MKAANELKEAGNVQVKAGDYHKAMALYSKADLYLPPNSELAATLTLNMSLCT